LGPDSKNLKRLAARRNQRSPGCGRLDLSARKSAVFYSFFLMDLVRQSDFNLDPSVSPPRPSRPFRPVNSPTVLPFELSN
jgi:hypothetical protein